jgi:Putative prokaryotic signal transducing protein
MVKSANDEEVEIARVPGRVAAEQVLSALRASGIAARMRHEAAGDLYGLTMDGMGEVTILVRTSQAEEARDLLKAADLGELRLGDQEPDDTGR